VTADAAAVDPRLVQLDCRIIDEIADLEIIGAVEDQVGIPDQFDDVGVVNVGDDGLDVNAGVDGAELASGGLGLGQVLGNVVLVEEDLALQVAGFDEVAIDQAQVADPGADKRVGQYGPQRPAAAESDVTVQEPPLTLLADAVEAHLTAVAF